MIFSTTVGTLLLHCVSGKILNFIALLSVVLLCS
jgi:hypothetical protein